MDPRNALVALGLIGLVFVAATLRAIVRYLPYDEEYDD